MQLNPQQLTRHLDQLHSCYFIHGDEPLLIDECTQALRQAARTQGHETREVFHITQHFKWDNVLATQQAMSLFSHRKLIEIRFSSSKLDKNTSNALCQLIQTQNPDNIILITSPSVPYKTQKSTWYKAVDQVGIMITIKPLPSNALAAWITERAKGRDLTIDSQAAELLAQKTEGNLLAAAQELDKLTLLYGNKNIGIDDVSAAVYNDARYDVFQLVDAALLQNTTQALNILNNIRESGIQPGALLWAFTRELRLIYQVLHHPQGIDAGVQEARIWPNKRIETIRAGAQAINLSGKRHINTSTHGHISLDKDGYKGIDHLLSLCLNIEKSIKGVEKAKPWELYKLLIMSMGSANQPKSKYNKKIA